MNCIAEFGEEGFTSGWDIRENVAKEIKYKQGLLDGH